MKGAVADLPNEGVLVDDTRAVADLPNEGVPVGVVRAVFASTVAVLVLILVTVLNGRVAVVRPIWVGPWVVVKVGFSLLVGVYSGAASLSDVTLWCSSGTGKKSEGDEVIAQLCRAVPNIMSSTCNLLFMAFQ